MVIIPDPARFIAQSNSCITQHVGPLSRSDVNHVIGPSVAAQATLTVLSFTLYHFVSRSQDLLTRPLAFLTSEV